MPEISRFHGIVIAMFYRDHSPPHFHAYHGSHEAAIAIRDGTLLWGELPAVVARRVEQWRELHIDELLADWHLARQSQRLRAIAPLEP